jgi:hypothetical protein
MIRHAVLFASALVLLASSGHSQTFGKKKNGPGEVELTFANGSLVRMTLLAEKIEINTEYGKLSVPVSDIRRIEFGLHLPDGADKKIENAVKQLGSAEYKEREGAVRELVALGAFAYPSLLQAIRSTEPEVAKRAQEAIAKIKARVPANDLRLGENDKVVTPRFTIVGRIITPSIKAKSDYFADAELSLANLRHLRAVLAARETDVVVDAAKHGNQWLDTGISLEASTTLSVLATGEVELRPSAPGMYVCGPRGYTRTSPFAAAAGKVKKGFDLPTRGYPGTLIGRIGDSGDTFVIGDRFEAPPERIGKLYLQIMASTYDNASTGSYHVKISVRD